MVPPIGVALQQCFDVRRTEPERLGDARHLEVAHDVQASPTDEPSVSSDQRAGATVVRSRAVAVIASPFEESATHGGGEPCHADAKPSAPAAAEVVSGCYWMRNDP
jgi:hypothetical protein